MAKKAGRKQSMIHVLTVETRHILNLGFEFRRANAPRQIDNSALRAGEPMYYYCRQCGVHTETLPEEHHERPRTTCEDCALLVNLGFDFRTQMFSGRITSGTARLPPIAAIERRAAQIEAMISAGPVALPNPAASRPTAAKIAPPPPPEAAPVLKKGERLPIPSAHASGDEETGEDFHLDTPLV